MHLQEGKFGSVHEVMTEMVRNGSEASVGWTWKMCVTVWGDNAVDWLVGLFNVCVAQDEVPEDW